MLAQSRGSSSSEYLQNHQLFTLKMFVQFCMKLRNSNEFIPPITFIELESHTLDIKKLIEHIQNDM